MGDRRLHLGEMMFRYALLVLVVSVASGSLAADFPAPVVNFLGVVSEFPCVKYEAALFQRRTTARTLAAHFC